MFESTHLQEVSQSLIAFSLQLNHYTLLRTGLKAPHSERIGLALGHTRVQILYSHLHKRTASGGKTHRVSTQTG